MTDTLRDRIAAAIYSVQKPWDGFSFAELSEYTQSLYREQADAVIRELPELTALRRCERCRLPYPRDQYPAMREGSDELRPFCIHCTNYIEWATS